MQQPSTSLAAAYPTGLSLSYPDFYLAALGPQPSPPSPDQLHPQQQQHCPPQAHPSSASTLFAHDHQPPAPSSFGFSAHVFPTPQPSAQAQAQPPAPHSTVIGTSSSAMFTRSPNASMTSPSAVSATSKSPGSFAAALPPPQSASDRDELHFFLHGHGLPLAAGPTRFTPPASQPMTDDVSESRETRTKRPSKDGKPAKRNPHFVSKLFYMLEDGSWDDVVRWSFTRDSFIVVNMDRFTKHVLPRHFKHSNFSSFVRQLNKYDFHKLKKDPALLEKLFHIEPGQAKRDMFDQMWEFKHECFRSGRPDLLDSVRRKVAVVVPSGAGKKGVLASGSEDAEAPINQTSADNGELSDLKQQLASLQAIQDGLAKHIGALSQQYETVITDMSRVHQNLMQQDKLMQRIVRQVSSASGRTPPTVTATPLSPNARLLSVEPSPTLSFRSDAAAASKSTPALEPQEVEATTVTDQADTPGTVSSDSLSSTPNEDDDAPKDTCGQQSYISLLSFASAATTMSHGTTSPLKRPANEPEYEPIVAKLPRTQA